MVRQLVMAMALCLLATTNANAASVRAVVDRNQATVGESIAMQVTIEDGKGTIDLSRITDFKTISRGTSSSFKMINGRTSRELIHNYVLIPLKAGNLTIPAIPVTIDGQTHYTAPIRIMVSEEPPVDSGKRDVYVTAAVSEASPWIGQQIAYTFRLFNAVQVAEAKFQAPAFDGFNAEELEDRNSYRTVINGREFIVTEVTFILVPVKTGTLAIEPAVLQAGLLQRNRRQRPFSGMDAFFGRTELTTRVLETDPIAVQVRALPTPPPGTPFSGLVGQFEISASLEKTDVRVGDSSTLAVTISGSGNIMDAPAPAIPAPNEFKVYADNPEVQVQLGTDGYTGSKTFRTALVPVQPGKYHIDPIVWSYFDTGTGGYRTLYHHGVRPDRRPFRHGSDRYRCVPGHTRPIPVFKTACGVHRPGYPSAENGTGQHNDHTLHAAPVVRPLFSHPGTGVCGRQNRGADHPQGRFSRAGHGRSGQNSLENSCRCRQFGCRLSLGALPGAGVGHPRPAGRHGCGPHLVGGQRPAYRHRVECR
jgi:hypothetical protein